MNAQQWGEALVHVEQNLAPLDKVVEKCEYELKPIYNSVKD